MTVPGQNRNRHALTQRRFVAVLVVMMLPVAAFYPGAASGDWRFDPILRAAWDFDDNATLNPRTDEETEISGYMGEASLDAIYTSERAYVSMRPILRTRNYGDDEDEELWNADDQFFDFLAVFNGDRNSFRVFGDYSREAVRTAEVADADLDTDVDPDDIADDQSGFVTSQRRTRYRLTPRWTHRFSDVSSLDTQVGFLAATYDEPDDIQLERLFDFTNIDFRLQYRRNVSPRTSTTFAIRARDYNTDRFGGDRQSYEVFGGLVRRLSETTQFRARLGLESVDREDVEGLPSTSIDPQPTAELSLSRNLETIRLLAMYRKRVNASGRGTLTARDELNLRFTRDLNDRVTVGLGARAYHTDTISGVENTQTYVQIRGQVGWTFSPSFSLQADYRHTVIDRGGPEGAADSNRVTIWLSYRPNPVGRDDRLRITF